MAVALRDDYQGNGIGSYLMEYLVEIAVRHDFRVIIAEVLFDNHAARHMMDRFKKFYPVEITSPGQGCVSYRVDVSSATEQSETLENAGDDDITFSLEKPVHCDKSFEKSTNPRNSTTEKACIAKDVRHIDSCQTNGCDKRVPQRKSDDVDNREQDSSDLNQFDISAVISPAGKMWTSF